MQTRWDTPQNFLLAFIHELWKTWKIRILRKWKKKKKCWRYHFTHAYQKPQSYEVHFLGYGVRQKNFLSFWAIFCPLLPHFPNNPENQNFEKMKKASGDLTLNFLPFDLPLTTQRIKILKNENNPLRYHHFTPEAYHKWQSYDKWSLRYQLQKTDFFVIFGHFLLFYSLNSPKNQNLKKNKSTWGYHFTWVYQKS